MGPYGVPRSLSMGPYGVPGSRDSRSRDSGSRDSGSRDLGYRDLGTRAQGWGLQTTVLAPQDLDFDRIFVVANRSSN